MYIDRTEEFYTIVNELKKNRITDSDLGGGEEDLFDLEEQDNDEKLGLIFKFHKLSRNVNSCIARMDTLVDNKFTAYVALAQNNFLSLDTPRLSVAEKEE